MLAGSCAQNRVCVPAGKRFKIRLRNNAPSPNNNTIIHRYFGCIAAVAFAAAAPIAEIIRVALVRDSQRVCMSVYVFVCVFDVYCPILFRLIAHA